MRINTFLLLMLVCFSGFSTAESKPLGELPKSQSFLLYVASDRTKPPINKQDKALVTPKENLTEKAPVTGLEQADGFLVEQPEKFEKFIDEETKAIQILHNDLQTIEENVNNKAIDPETLARLKDQLSAYIDKILEKGVGFRAPLTEIIFQFAQTDTTQKDVLDTLQKKKAKINTLLSSLEGLYSHAYAAINSIDNKKQELFTRSLTDHVPLGHNLNSDIVQKQSAQIADHFLEMFNHWVHSLTDGRLFHFIFALLFPLILGFYIRHFIKHFLKHFTKNAYEQMQRSKKLESDQNLASTNDTASQKEDLKQQPHFTVAFLSIFLPLIPWVLFFSVSYEIADLFGLLNENVGPILKSIGIEFVLVLFFYRLARAVFWPMRPALQLIPVRASSGQMLVILITALAALIGLDSNIDTVFSLNGAPDSLNILKNLNMIFLANAIIFAIIFVYPERTKKNHKNFFGFSYWKLGAVILTSLPSFFALMGYVNLAHYVMQQIVVGGALLFFLYLGLITGRHIALDGAFEQSFLGRIVKKYYPASPAVFNQLGLILGFLIDILVTLICVPAMLVQLGFSPKTIYKTVLSFLTEFQIGTISISPISIFIGLIVFFISLFLLRRFISWLDTTVMLRGNIDSGVRNSIRTVLSYGAFALSVLIGLSVAGLNLSSLAIIAGGLSLGIGFGLQNIVQNFVSGLIILVERPFKAGDYIESGSASGLVKRINVRATEVETPKRETIIIPNSSFINSNVSNWTKHSLVGRVDVPITIPAKKDPEEVYNLLTDILKETDDILKHPAPYIAFSNFDSKNLTFTVSVYLGNILKPLQATNSLKYKIYRRLAEEGVFE